MASVNLVHPEETHVIPVRQAINKCRLFENNPAFTVSPYRVQSSVTLSVFREFVAALKGNAVEITDANFTGLQRLCEEFGFDEFSATVSQFRPSILLRETETLERIVSLEERAQRSDHHFALLEVELRRLAMEVASLRPGGALMQTQSGDVSVPQQLTMEIHELQNEISILKIRILTMKLSSRILPNFPEIFTEFQGKRFWLLWRGSRDGFAASAFHGRCDGHANTLTVVLDVNGNIFGGFTPMEWESRAWNGKHGNETSTRKADETGGSFIFTLKNPHNVETKIFPLKAEGKQRALVCDSGWGTVFWGGIAVCNNSNTNGESWTSFGTSYIHEPGRDKDTFFTGSHHFKVKEIEVFEMTD